MSIFYIYLFCAVVGVGLITVGLLTGGHHGDASGDIHMGHSADIHSGDANAPFWLPLLSFYFWVFNLAVFGGCGVMLSLLAVPQLFTLPVSLILGTLFGLFANKIISFLKNTKVDSSVTEDDYYGLEAEVTSSIKKGHTGKIQLFVKNKMVEMLATSPEDELEIGDKVHVIGLNEDNKLEVMDKRKLGYNNKKLLQ